jgi:DNA-3-methyladenine glycosylase II
MTKAGRAAAGALPLLTEEALARGVALLAARDADLARVVREFGRPPLWAREAGFETLVLIILEQQVSLASARAAYARLLAAAREMTPARLARMSDADVRAAGITRQKTAYVKDLARLIIEGGLDLRALDRLDDDAARAELMKVKGVGKWTADIYLLMALGRADVWPAGDLALAVAAERVKRLPSRPTPSELTALAEAWRPWRAAAARVLWKFYLTALK